MRCFLLFSVSLTLALSATPGADASPRYKQFDVPGSSFTEASAINDHGAVVGLTGLTSVNATVGFIRNPKGRFKTFTVPGADGGVQVSYINNSSEVAGSWSDASFRSHGFVRAKDGTIKTFDCPGATATDSTSVHGINDLGIVSGSCSVGGLQEAFIGNPATGPVTPFEVSTFSTFGGGVNQAGEMTGYYVDSGYHGFLRDPGGTLTAPVDVPGSTATKPAVINGSGAIAGLVTAPGKSAFYRDALGTSTAFGCGWGAPGATSVNLVTDLSDNGTLTGSCVLGVTYDFHGFEWRNGVIRTIEPPGASASAAEGINKYGVVAGYAAFPAGDIHGFMYVP